MVSCVRDLRCQALASENRMNPSYSVQSVYRYHGQKVQYWYGIPRKNQQCTGEQCMGIWREFGTALIKAEMLVGTSRVFSVASLGQVETNWLGTGRSQVMRRVMKPDVCALKLRLALWRACASGWFQTPPRARSVQMSCIGSCAPVESRENMSIGSGYRTVGVGASIAYIWKVFDTGIAMLETRHYVCDGDGSESVIN